MAENKNKITSCRPVNVESSEFLNLEKCTSVEYVVWIKEYILKVASGKHVEDEREWYLLPTPEQIKQKKMMAFFTVYLEKNDGNANDPGNKYIFLTFRRHDLYLIAYSFDFKNWFIFNDIVTLQKNVTKLQYNSSYGSLEANSDKVRQVMLIWKFALQMAFDDLHRARKSNTDVDTTVEARSLLSFMIMFSEAFRFKSVMNLVSDNFDSCSETFGLYHTGITNKWSTASTAIVMGKPRSDDEVVEDARREVQVLKAGR